MNQMWTCKVVTVDEFKEHLLACLLHDAENYSKEQLFKFLLEDGFPKFNIEDMKNFMKGLQCRVFLAPICIDFGDSMFYWLVCGTDAILIHKTFDNWKVAA